MHFDRYIRRTGFELYLQLNMTTIYTGFRVNLRGNTDTVGNIACMRNKAASILLKLINNRNERCIKLTPLAKTQYKKTRNKYHFTLIKQARYTLWYCPALSRVQFRQFEQTRFTLKNFIIWMLDGRVFRLYIFNTNSVGFNQGSPEKRVLFNCFFWFLSYLLLHT